MTAWFDAHNHLQDPRLPNAADMISAMKAAGITGCVVNATREDDWARVAALAEAAPDFVVPAFGIHPWHAHTAMPGWQDRLAALLEKFPLASIGECGVDGWVNHPPLEIQRPVFLEQLRLARELDRSVTIHCLKAWGAMFECFDATAAPARFLMHSFGGSIETAHRLIPLGAFFSFSGYFLQPRKAAVVEVFRQLPRDRVLVETDAPDMSPPAGFATHPMPEKVNHPANLAAIGSALAGLLGTTPESLAASTRAAARRCFALESPRFPGTIEPCRPAMPPPNSPAA